MGRYFNLLLCNTTIKKIKMTPEEFVIWLQGFVAASNHYNLTPAGWDELKEQLKKVKQ